MLNPPTSSHNSNEIQFLCQEVQLLTLKCEKEIRFSQVIIIYVLSICSHISCSVAFVATSINQSGILLIRKVNKCDFMSSTSRAIALLCLQIDIKNVA